MDDPSNNDERLSGPPADQRDGGLNVKAAQGKLMGAAQIEDPSTLPVASTIVGNAASADQVTATKDDDFAAALAEIQAAKESIESPPTPGPNVDDIPPSHDRTVQVPPAEPVGFVRRLVRFGLWLIWSLFCIASLIVLLAVLTAVPIIQLIAFGYLLDVAGRLTAGGKFRHALPHLSAAGTIGMAGAAIFLASLATQLLVHWESVAQVIDPGSAQASTLRIIAIAFSLFVMGYLLWAWVRGGSLKHYVWPQPIRFLKEGWRPKTWKDLPDRLWDFTVSLELPRLFWLGARGVAGTLVWLIPAMLVAAMIDNGTNGLAGLVGFVSLVLLGIALLYVPMLQAHFAAENRFSALFEVRRIRQDFRRAPWAWLVAMIFGLVLLPIPLYLLKIEPPPREVLWLPCLVFVAFILPARIGMGLALRRARRRPEPEGLWAAISRSAVRILMPGVVGIYLVFVGVSQYTSWDGLATWVQQHAILIPIPFFNGT